MVRKLKLEQQYPQNRNLCIDLTQKRVFLII
jgi:hypothetical protein